MTPELNFYLYTGTPSGVDIVTARRFIRDGWVPAPQTVLKGRCKTVKAALSKMSVDLKEMPIVLKQMLVLAMETLPGDKRTLMFSGGFDSMLMLLLAREHGATVNGVTIQFENFNTATVASAVALAKKLQLPHRILNVSVAEFLSAFPKVVQITQEPLLDLDMALVYAAFKKYRTTMPKQTFISGMGSDQWLGNIFLEPEYGSLQERLDMTTQYKKAHHRVAKSFGHTFVFPYLSKHIVSLALCMTPSMKKDKLLLRSLASGTALNPTTTYRELQIPDIVRRVLVKVYGQRAWPRALTLAQQKKYDESTLRKIVLGLWLEKNA
jgi:asparagine synthetase B (glutamine-hydrolysing)